MKKKQTAKYRRRHKKEVANRKAKQLEEKRDEIEHAIRVSDGSLESESRIDDQVVELAVLEGEEPKPVSPARRAFQDV